MTTFDEAVNAIREHDANFQGALKWWPAYLGDGEGNVAASQSRYYYCRYPTKDNPAVEVYANGCPSVDGMSVRVGYSADQPDMIKILSWTDPSLDNTQFPVQPHAEQHGYLANDTVWVDLRQITTLKVQPFYGLVVYVNGGVLPSSGSDLYVYPQTVDLTGYVPTSSGNARMALLSLDSTGEIVVTSGSLVSPLTSLDVSDVPDTPTGNFRLAAVALAYGQTTIEENVTRRDIVDLRWPQESIAGSPYALFGTQTANTVLAGPTTGAAALPSFRALVDADLPVHDIVSAHDTSGRTAGQVLQAASATTLGWSTNTLSIAGNSTINGSLIGNISGGGTIATGGFTGTLPESMTFAGRNVANTFTAVQTITAPSSTALTGALIVTQTKTGTAAGVYKYVDYTGTISPSSNPGGSQDYYLMNAIIQTAADATVYSGLNVRSFYLSPRHNGSGTINTLVGGYVDIYNLSTGTVTNGMGYYALIRNSGSGLGKITNARNFWAANMVNAATASDNQYAFYADALTSATNNYLLYGAGLGRVRVGDDVSIIGGADRAQLTVTGFATQTATTTLVQATRNDANTNALGTLATWTHNSTGTAAAGFGSRHLWQLESSTTAGQDAAALDVSWTDATHATRTSRLDVSTTGPGKCAAWGYNGVDGTARTIIANGTGDVTEGITVQYVASEVTGTDSYGGIVYLEPSDSFAINTDGTNALTLACAADGSVTIQRTAGTDTYKVMLWMVWQ